MMTWGTIESTPVRVEGDATPGPIFKIPEAPEREKLGLKLSKEISRKQREFKKATSISALKARYVMFNHKYVYISLRLTYQTISASCYTGI